MSHAFKLIQSAIAIAAIFNSTQATGADRSIPQVEIGHFKSQDEFNLRGYGIIVKFQGKCLVLTLAHVAQTDLDDQQYDSVTVRTARGTATTVNWVYHNRQVYDLYVGDISQDGPLLTECNSAVSIDELYEDYILRLNNMINQDFEKISLHIVRDSISLVPEDDRVLSEALGGEPIRYTLQECRSGPCEIPVKKLSGAIISTRVGNESRIVLGLHQGRCELHCPVERPVWKAVSIITIYQFFYMKNFPIKSENRSEFVETNLKIERKNFILRIQEQLERLNCDPGKIDGKWGPQSIRALERFRSAYGGEFLSVVPGEEMLTALEGQQPISCAPPCAEGSILKDGACQSVEVNRLRGTSVRPAKTAKPRPRAAPNSQQTRGECIHVNGKIAC